MPVAYARRATSVQIVVEDGGGLSEALAARGAEAILVTLHMRGPLPPGMDEQ